MSNVALESGDGLGYVAKVGADGSVGVAVRNTVTTQPEQCEVARTEVSVTTTPLQIVDANSARRKIQIQNLSSVNSFHIRLGGTATTNDLRIDPGETYELPDGTTFTGEIGGLAVAGDAQAIVVEFNR